MMSTGYEIKEQDKLHYVTFQVVHWVDVFTRRMYRDIVIDCLAFCQKNKGLEIFAYVIMSNHIHLLIRNEQKELSKTIREIKSYTAKKILESVQTENESRSEWLLNIFEFSSKRHKRNEKYQLWTHENHSELIYSEKFIEQKINYIHENPVRSGIVTKAEDYLYSSARNYAELENVLDITKIELQWKIC
ncbi:MAG: transposase [Prevotellaceae bacterium]|jgi:REP element-mobilizing transposase RayT|nr:transposase [Prevotellaceae bacterium]